jgi:hypothetical protein
VPKMRIRFAQNRSPPNDHEVAFSRFESPRHRSVLGAIERLQELYGFPRGRLLSPNCRIWDEEEDVNPWLESRPVDGNPLRGAAKVKKARKAAAQSAAEA